ncbi:MAG: Gfo/Idh/MocA family oxidoreductase [Planctomycetes bacterium]|nr:Gfo/Idh/MocA family oxidoreductase [Planctomycetota bacterium]
MTAASSIGVGVVGLGFMGRTHVAAYESARKAGYACKLVAVADQDARRLDHTQPFRGNLGGAGAMENLFDPAHVRAHTEMDGVLNDPAVQLVSICTPTDSHVELALRALDAGKHVLIEKPVAVRSADVAKLAAAAAGAKTLCMPAMCMRFWPGWSWLKQAIVEKTYGELRSAVFERLASPPGWASEFYRDAERSGGALVDLHIHDADFVRWCFGDPVSIASTGTRDHVTTLYRFASGPPHVVAEGGWDHTPGFPFKMRYVAAFEHATAEFDSGREPPLLLATNGELNPIPLESITGWDLEIRHMVLAISEGRRELTVSMQDALRVTELLEVEHESQRRGEVIPFRKR